MLSLWLLLLVRCCCCGAVEVVSIISWEPLDRVQFQLQWTLNYYTHEQLSSSCGASQIKALFSSRVAQL